jgi:O-antigen/teichoic acid export membrane protein
VTDGDGAPLGWSELGRRSARAALQLTVRGLVVRGLIFLGTLALARILLPTDFGVYAIVSFVVSIWASFGDFGLGAALVQQRDEPSNAQLQTVWTAQQAIAIAAVAVIWVAAPVLTGLLPDLPGDAPWMLRVLSLGLLFSSLRSLPSVMMERALRFGPLAAAEIAQQAVYYCLAIPLAVAGFRAWSFVIAGVAQLAVGAVVVNLAWRRRPSIGLDRTTLRRSLGFGLSYQLGVALTLLRDTPVPVMAGAVLGAASAGVLQFAMRIALTIASIDEIIGRVAFPAFSRLQGRKAEQGRALAAATTLTALVVVPVQCSLAAFAPVLVPALFGPQWTAGVVPVQIFCVATLFRFPTRYLRQTIFAEGATGPGVGAAGLIVEGLPGAAIAFLVGAGTGLVATAWLARRWAKPDWRPYLRIVVAGLTAGGSSLTALHLAGGGLLGAAGAAALFAAVFSGLVWSTDRDVVRLGWRLASTAIGRSAAASRG